MPLKLFYIKISSDKISLFNYFHIKRNTLQAQNAINPAIIDTIITLKTLPLNPILSVNENPIPVPKKPPIAPPIPPIYLSFPSFKLNHLFL